MLQPREQFLVLILRAIKNHCLMENWNGSRSAFVIAQRNCHPAGFFSRRRQTRAGTFDDVARAIRLPTRGDSSRR